MLKLIRELIKEIRSLRESVEALKEAINSLEFEANEIILPEEDKAFVENFKLKNGLYNFKKPIIKDGA